MPLCSYCRHKLSEFGDKTFKEFTDMLETSRLDAAMGTDIFGYTQGWERISREYRESKDYTCEICGLKIENPLDRMYMHCHHKNGDKTNNDFSNLQCLCIRCHSQVDQRHATNFSKCANLNELKDFEEKYPLKQPPFELPIRNIVLIILKRCSVKSFRRKNFPKRRNTGRGNPRRCIAFGSVRIFSGVSCGVSQICRIFVG